MASALDHRQIAQDAELTPGEVEHFVAGLAGETTEPLPLVRDIYDELQRILEEHAVATRESGRRVWDDGLGLWYFTEKPPTPSYRPEHPRREILMRMFSAGGRGPSACSVFTLQGFHATDETLSPVQRRAFVDFLCGNIPDRGLPSVCMTPRGYIPPSINYFVLGRGEDREPVAFSAEQSGVLHFGMKAEEMKGRVAREFMDNDRLWGAPQILRLLNGD